MLAPLNFRAGVIMDDTRTASEGFATGSQLIRFVRGRPETWKGWERGFADNANGRARGYFGWARNNGTPYQAIGTNTKLYAAVGGQVLNITPKRSNGAFAVSPFSVTNLSTLVTATLTAHGAITGDTVVIDSATAVGGITPGGPSGSYGATPFSTVIGSPTVTITHAAHGMATGDTTNIAAASAVGGITLGGAYLIYVYDANTYTVDAGTNATSTATGGGAPTYAMGRAYVVTVVDANTFTFNHIAAATSTAVGGGTPNYLFEINVGLADGVGGYGFGFGGWGSGPFGLGVANAIGFQPRIWSLCNFGESLLACPYGGTIYRWDLNASRRAAVLTNAPAQVNWILVTAERVVMAFGCTNLAAVYDPNLVRWCDSEDATVWTPAVTNIAGDLRLGEGSLVISARLTSGGVITWTDTTSYFIRYNTNPDIIYEANPLGAGGLIGPNAAAEHNGTVWWITGRGDFYTYTGGSPRPVRNPNRTWFINRNAAAQAWKIWALIDSAYSAVEFWFQSTTSTADVNEYLRLDYLETANDLDAGWSVGVLDRTIGLDSGVFANPYMISSSGVIYIHEQSFSDNGSPVTRYITYAPIELVTQAGGKGSSVLNLRRLLIDATLTVLLKITVAGYRWPNATPQIVGPKTVMPTTKYLDIRMQARQLALTIQTDGDRDWWRLGDLRADTSVGPSY